MTTMTDGDLLTAATKVVEQHTELQKWTADVFHARPNAEQRRATLEFLQHVWLCTFGIDELRPAGDPRLTPDECKALVLGTLVKAQEGRKAAWNARALIAQRSIATDEYPLHWAVMQLAITNLGWEL